MNEGTTDKSGHGPANSDPTPIGSRRERRRGFVALLQSGPQDSRAKKSHSRIGIGASPEGGAARALPYLLPTYIYITNIVVAAGQQQQHNIHTYCTYIYIQQRKEAGTLAPNEAWVPIPIPIPKSEREKEDRRCQLSPQQLHGLMGCQFPSLLRFFFGARKVRAEAQDSIYFINKGDPP